MAKISIVVATNKTFYWKRFISHVSKNSIDIEIIFVGPCKPDNTLPVRFIYSDAKPALALEIGARLATSKLLCLAVDDITYTPHFFDDAVKAMASLGEFDVVTAHYYHNNIDRLEDMRMMSLPNMPLMSVDGVARTASHHKLGGIDNRFNAIYFEVDLWTRFHATGGKTIMLENHICHELDIDQPSSMFQRNYEHDRPIIEALWMRNGAFCRERNLPIKPYTGIEAGFIKDMVSIIVVSNRPKYWQRFSDHIAANNVNIEIIMVTPCEPNHQLSKPTYYIKTDANIVLCWQAGANLARGEFICFMPDDVCFTPYFFDDTINVMKDRDEYDMVTARFFDNWVDQIAGMRMMSVQYMPLTPVCGVLRTASFHKLGGIDKRFQGIFWDADLYTRFYEAGGRTTLLNHHCHAISDDSNLYTRNHNHDLKIIHDLWYKDGQPQLERNDKVVQSFSNEEINNILGR